MAEFRLSEQANRSLIDIAIQGYAQFGELQSDKYQAELQARFALLAGFPKMGRLAPAIGDGIRRHEYGSHVIFYREDERGIVIVSVVHAYSVHSLEL